MFTFNYTPQQQASCNNILMRYKTLVLIAISICVLWIARCVFTQELEYGFIPVNIFLATVPLLLLYPARKARHHLQGLMRKASLAFIALLWLLFLPNAFYIITDFMHLNPAVLVNERNDNYEALVIYGRGDGLFIFDSFLVLSATIFGAYVGGLALVHGYTYLRRRLPARYAQATLGLILLLSAIGVYIGRFGRWNSWQGITHPHHIIGDLINDLTMSERRERLIILVVTLILFQIASFLYVKRAVTAKPQV
jgi:uncharacterized membrane protein